MSFPVTNNFNSLGFLNRVLIDIHSVYMRVVCSSQIYDNQNKNDRFMLM